MLGLGKKVFLCVGGLLVCQFWLSEGSPELNPWVEKSVNLTVFSLLTTSWEETSFLEEQPG